ncbi:MAG: hypothetical protein J5556_02445, partial [Deltaproteobacteria bacterium]|nr:hypothetical protein [Deltaproteobacteria bacterium]
MNDLLAYASLVIVAQCVVMVLLGFALPRWRDARRSAPGRETPRTFSEKFKAVLETNSGRPVPTWLERDNDALTGKVINLPDR